MKSGACVGDCQIFRRNAAAFACTMSQGADANRRLRAIRQVASSVAVCATGGRSTAFQNDLTEGAKDRAVGAFFDVETCGDPYRRGSAHECRCRCAA